VTPDRAGAGPVLVTGWSLHLPGLPADPPDLVGVTAPGGDPPCPPEAAHRLLGRKGLLGKDAATRLALCAVHRALGLTPGERPGGDPDPATAVVASSNLGNVGTVVDVVRAVHRGGRREVSPLAAPSASSNVVASTVAIWFRCGGPGLMVCSGAASGLDAVRLAVLLLRAGRAQRVVVVGTEPADTAAVALLAGAGPGAALRAGAACVLLQLGPGRPGGTGPGGPVLLTVGAEQPPGCAEGAPEESVGSGALAAAVGGDLYGAAGVAQVAVAAARAARGAIVRVSTDGGTGPGLTLRPA
jgi:3-oxoacyl-[acyl-carrier-protein] synthase II